MQTRMRACGTPCARYASTGAAARRRLTQLRRSGSTDGPLPPPPDIAQLASMARLEVSAEEAAAWSPRINAIVEWCARLQRAVRLASRSFPPLRFGKLRDVDVSAAGPVVRAGEADASEAELSQRLRADVVVDFPQRDEMLAAAATLESPFIRIPKIME